METVLTSKKNGILTVTLNRADVHNAFNSEMIEDLTKVFVATHTDKSIRAVVLRGAGKSFCAGADLNWMKSMVQYSFEDNIQDSNKLFSMFESIAKCPAPVVGRIQGSVFGGGIGLTAVCDIVAAQVGTKFCFSEVKLGLVPAVISPFVIKKTGQSRARQMMLTAQLFDESKALEMGLVHFIGQNEEEVEDFVQSQVDFIATSGPEAVRETKSLLDFLATHSWSEIKSQTAKVIAERRASAEGQEGMKAFFEKRKPGWKP